MYPDSKELARRIDILTAFQNGEEIEHRSIGKGSTPWTGKYGDSPQTLCFNFDNSEYRKKAQPREGYIFATVLHNHPEGYSHRPGEHACFKVREVLHE